MGYKQPECDRNRVRALAGQFLISHVIDRPNDGDTAVIDEWMLTCENPDQKGSKKMKKETIHVKGMSCQHCVNAIKEALENINVHAEVDLQGKKVTVAFDENQIDLGRIKEAIEDQGYDTV